MALWGELGAHGGGSMRLSLVCLLVACGGKGDGPPPLPVFGDSGLAEAGEGDDSADTDAPEDPGEPEDTGVPFCGDAPVINYVNFGEGFMLEACQGCHATDTPDRYGAPESVNFDTAPQIWAQVDRILVRAVGEYATMPPLGGVVEQDRLKLQYWLECGEAGS
jgi:hypothetical protein